MLNHTYTEDELLIRVQQFYKSFLSVEKAINIYELEFGVKPIIQEQEEDNRINVNLPEIDKIDFSIYKPLKVFKFLKNLQESGTANMVTEARQYLQLSFPYLERSNLSAIMSVYLKKYNANLCI